MCYSWCCQRFLIFKNLLIYFWFSQSSIRLYQAWSERRETIKENISFSTSIVPWIKKVPSCISEAKTKNWYGMMDAFCPAFTGATGSGSMISRCCFLTHFLCLKPNEFCLKSTAYLIVVVHPFMILVYPSANGYVQQDYAPCHILIVNICDVM